jgi:hypothetical protein
MSSTSALGLIVVGDYALATGADTHVSHAAAALARTSDSLAWAWLIPSDRTQLAAALFEAWQRRHPVACFGGLGDGVDDPVRTTIHALQKGREEVGQPRHVQHAVAGGLQVGNIAFFSGHPARARADFDRWWQSQLAASDDTASMLTSEQLRWQLPETTPATLARRAIKLQHSTIAQRVIAAADGGVALRLSGASKGKVQAARKALQAALKQI